VSVKRGWVGHSDKSIRYKHQHRSHYLLVYVGGQYRLTSIVQQFGRGGRNGEISNSIIIAKVRAGSTRE
jgi:hypothetical protein